MATVVNEVTEVMTPRFKINSVDSSAPKRWLEQGIADLKVRPGVSMSYSAVYVLIGLLMLWMTWENPIFITTFAGGFLMIGPIVSVVFYRISRRIEQGRNPELGQGMNAWNFNSISLVSFALVLGTLMAAWAIVSALMIGFFTAGELAVYDTMWETLINHSSAAWLVLTYFLGGGLLAAVAFSISVVAVPMLTDHEVDIVTAMSASIKAVRKNPTPMLAWAFIIATLMFLGFLLFFIGLIVIMPIIGHASWHAYRDLVEPE